MWGAFQHGFVFQMGEQLRKAGHGESPYRLVVGSSSGSLIAPSAAAGVFEHDLARSTWINFGRAIRLSPRKLGNPFPGILNQVFEEGLIPTDRAFQSPNQVILAATCYHPDEALALGRGGIDLLREGISGFLKKPSEENCERLCRRVSSLLETGARLFNARYFATKPEVPPTEKGEWTVVESPEEFRTAVEASSRIPFLCGAPIAQGADLLIDGVFADNAPVELALKAGARHVFVVTSSKKGYVFDRPVQSMIRKTLRMTLGKASLSSARDLIPPPAPLDIAALRKAYPGQQIHIIHPDENISVNRFFESRPEIIGSLYDMGRRVAGRLRKSIPEADRINSDHAA